MYINLGPRGGRDVDAPAPGGGGPAPVQPAMMMERAAPGGAMSLAMVGVQLFALEALSVTARRSGATAIQKRPNFVLFLQDDQDFLDGRAGLRPMAQTLELIADKGAFAENCEWLRRVSGLPAPATPV